MIDLKTLREADPEIALAAEAELNRQRDNLELIASENFVSPAVLAAAGTHLTNKYAEGYPGRRYYGGCVNVDTVERLAIERLKKLFGCEHANVQPHSGAQANFAVYFAALKPGDTILGMSLSHGGHLTHGSSVNISGKYFNIVPYTVSEKDERIDYAEVLRLAREHKPKLIVCGASAYCRTIDFEAFRKIADETGALLMADIAHIAGLVIAGAHPNPVPYCDFVTSTTHKTMRGIRGGIIMCKEKYAKDIDKAIFPGTQGGPLMHIIAAKAVAFKEALEPEFKTYIGQVVKNATAMADRFMENGIRIVTGGTDNHLMLLDLRSHGISGKSLEILLDECNITVNKNTIPYDPESPNITSGIRIGTPAVTTRGMKEKEMREIADIITTVVKSKEAAVQKAKERVLALTKKFPLYANDIID